MNIALYVTGHGYGHLTRLLEVGRALHERSPDTAIHVRAPFSAEVIKRLLGFEPESFADIRLDIGLVQLDSLHHDIQASLEKLRYYYGPDGDQLVKQEVKWLKDKSIDAALIDISPRAFEACVDANIPSTGIGNFGWDTIWQSLTSEEKAFQIYADRARESYATATRFFRAKMAIDLSAFQCIEDVPLIARRSQLESKAIRSMLQLPNNQPCVLLAFGGEGMQNGIAIPENISNQFTVISTPPLENIQGAHIRINDEALADHGLRFYDLVKAVDLVITKPGYSTVAECLANRAAIVYTPRTNFIEAPAIIDFIQNNIPSTEIPHEDLINANWETALVRLMTQKDSKFSDQPVNGSDVIAQRVVELYGS